MNLKNFQNKIFLTSLIVFIACLYTLISGVWPEVYAFATDPNGGKLRRILEAPVHLSDDVMISLRAGYMVNEVGMPAFNRFDVAQPSTSYVSPYLFDLLQRLFPENIAVSLYAGIGFLSVLAAFAVVLMCAKSLMNAVLIVAALSLTSTHLAYALNGWDHLFQAAFLTFAAAIVLKNKTSFLAYTFASICLALGSLFRPDGILIAVSIIVSAYLMNKSNPKKLFYLAIPFVTVVAGVLFVNFMQFGHLMPTTARLKIGASPSFGYAVSYVFNNGVFSFSAISVIILLTCFYFGRFKIVANKVSLPIVIACLLTSSISFLNSDVFGGGRMFWSAACVIALVVAVGAPRLLVLKDGFIDRIGFASDYLVPPSFERVIKSIFITVLAIFILSSSLRALAGKIANSPIREDGIYRSPTAQQFKIARWIDRNLDPKNGAIGFYYLGVSYHLPRFEIADFLGKADELIAVSDVRWGPPGHNKWNTDMTLNKWNLQAIVPPGNSDFTKKKARDAAEASLKKRVDYGFAPDLLVNDNVRKNYSYCYLMPVNEVEMPDSWGFMLRKDLAEKNYADLRCYSVG